MFPVVVSVCEDDPNYADKCGEKAAIEGYCKDQEEFMKKECPKSCGFCSPGKSQWLSKTRYISLSLLNN